MEMESNLSNKSLLFSCWGRLKLKLPWLKRSSADRRRNKNSAKSLTTNLDCKSIANTLSVTQPKPIPIGGFHYDPLSYSQNFDDGSWPADGDAPSRGFSSRSPPRHVSRPLELR